MDETKLKVMEYQIGFKIGPDKTSPIKDYHVPKSWAPIIQAIDDYQKCKRELDLIR
jgi:hypothetical protein